MSLESIIKKKIMLAIGSMPDVYVLQNAVGRAKYDASDGGQFYVPYGLEKGSPDLVVFLQTPWELACIVGLEVKQPGKAPTAEQLLCHERWRARGALVYTIQSEKEAVKAIENARAIVRHRYMASAVTPKGN